MVGMRTHWRVEPDSGAIHTVRHAFAEWLRQAVNGANPLLEYEIVFGELVTNAVRYGKRPVDVDVDVEPRKLTIRVEDWGECFDLSQPVHASSRSEGGRGLEIVKSLASAVRVEAGAEHPCVVVATLDVLA